MNAQQNFERMQQAQQRQYPDAVPEPCNDCPWRRNAKAGWLGPHDAVEWTEIAHSDSPVACHQTIRKTNDEGVGDWEHPAMRQCRGAAMFRANVLKTPRNPNIATGPEDHERVFSNNAEFVNYHERTNVEYSINICGDRMKLADEFLRMAEDLRMGRDPDWYLEGNGSDEPDIAIHTEHTDAGDKPLVEWRRL